MTTIDRATACRSRLMVSSTATPEAPEYSRRAVVGSAFLVALVGMGGVFAPWAVGQSTTTPSDTNPTTVSVLTRLRGMNPHLSAADPRELPMKLRSLLRDEYTFFRGTADLFYAHATGWSTACMTTPAARLLLHGDVHVGNVGVYQSMGAPGEDLAFGVVDLDEVFEGPFCLDLLRAATALRFAASDNGVSMDADHWNILGRELSGGYIAALTTDGNLAAEMSRSSHVSALFRKARKNRPASYAEKYVHPSPPRFRRARIKGGKPADLMEPVAESVRGQIVQALWNYYRAGCAPATRARWRATTEAEWSQSVLDVVRWTRLGSSGSQGVHKYLVLIDRPLKDLNDSLILQLKEQPTPAAVRGGLIADARGDRSAYVADAHDSIADQPEWLVGYTTMGDRTFLVRTKDPWGEDLDSTDFRSHESLRSLSKLLGQVIGSAHRAALAADSREAARREIARTIQDETFLSELVVQSAEMELFLRGAYAQLKTDPLAQALLTEAEAYLSEWATAE